MALLNISTPPEASLTMSLCESDYEYCSDYEYDSENETTSESHNDSSISLLSSNCSMVSIQSQTPLAELKDTIPSDIIQYHWTVLCSRLADTYPFECIYDIRNNLTIQFIANNRTLALEVANTTNAALWYPYAPPKVSLTGTAMMLSDYLTIVSNTCMHPMHWNLCVDLNVFIHKALRLMKESPVPSHTKETDAMEKNLLHASTIVGMTYDFGSSKLTLPAMGTARNVASTTGYLPSGVKISTVGSLVESLTKPIVAIVPYLSLMEPFHDDILERIIARVLESKASKLEVTLNEKFYLALLSIINSKCYGFEVDYIKDMFSDEITVSSDNKVSFVESFAEHYFSSNVSVAKAKFVKRIFAEIEQVRNAMKDFDGYLLVSEANVQQMKLLLIPDYDTPYGGGYFEFDIWVPTTYPDEPPKMHFLTTGQGTVRFNPNLYNCGKVCLSILGTWAQNQWNPKSSTLAQVILSVFSMIFVEHPYTNEPAWYNALETEQGRMRSKKYSDNIRIMCAEHAIKDQIKNEHTPFKDIIQKHWSDNKDRTIEAYEKHGIQLN